MDPALRHAIVDPLLSVPVLLRSRPIPLGVTTSALIGPAGGTLRLPTAGLTVVVPPKALSATTRISVTAQAGVLVAYHFAPHGTTFNVPLQVTQDLTYTLTAGTTASSLKGGYFAAPAQLNLFTRQALINEFLPLAVSDAGTSVTLGISHFSGYVIATGHK